MSGRVIASANGERFWMTDASAVSLALLRGRFHISDFCRDFVLRPPVSAFLAEKDFD